MVKASPCIALVPDGSAAWFMELLPAVCSGGAERLSGVLGDGSGYRVLLDAGGVEALHPDNVSTRVVELAVSGDGNTLAALIPDSLSGCSAGLPFHVWLIDTQTGDAAELSPGWPGGITFPSFSDDGERITYVATDAIGRYVMTASRSTPISYDKDVEVLFAPGDLGVSYVSLLSGDGQSLLLAAYQGFTVDDLGYLYRYHLPTGRLLKLVDEQVHFLETMGISRDGRRVIYGLHSDPYSPQPVFGVAGDGSDLHVVTPTHLFGSSTLSRDGKWVYYTDMSEDFSFWTWRVPWEGGEPEIVGAAFYNTESPITKYALSADGALLALRDDYDAYLVPKPLTLIRFGQRWLTTYGPETPGQPLHCDVGGPPGAPFTLFGSLWEAEQRTPFGVLGLEPSRLTVLGQGTIAGPDNVVTVPFDVPDDPALLDVAYHFQALVGGGAGSLKAGLTNSTTVTFGPAP